MIENQFFIWEEKNLTEPKKNFENKNESGTNVTTPNTEIKLEKEISIDTIKRWARICPQCKKISYYNNKKNRNQANKTNRICRKCKDNSQLRGENRKCLNCNKLFYASIAQSKRGWALFCSCKCNYLFGLGNKIYKPTFSLKACKFIDELNKKMNWHLQHALNGGELQIIGYFLDGYDKERNIVLEYDEKHHFDKNKNLKQKDIHRMNEIKKHIKCKFYRYNEQKNELKEYEN